MPKSENTIPAARLTREIHLDAAHPAREWQSAEPVRFSSDWQGKNPDPGLETEVRVLWSPTMLYLQFVCHYRELFVFGDSGPDGRRDHLWDRDVAEAFLQPPDSLPADMNVAQAERSRFYKEFEVAPNGMWIDLDISPLGGGDLRSGLERSVHIDKQQKIWTAELAIPMNAVSTHFDPKVSWRVNFYRVEGKSEPRKYMAWQPTMTSKPNFHVPEKFGTLTFQ